MQIGYESNASVRLDGGTHLAHDFIIHCGRLTVGHASETREQVRTCAFVTERALFNEREKTNTK